MVESILMPFPNKGRYSITKCPSLVFGCTLINVKLFALLRSVRMSIRSICRRLPLQILYNQSTGPSTTIADAHAA